MIAKNYTTNRKLVNLIKLCEHYNQKTINIAYEYNPTAKKIEYINTPLSVNIFIRMKCYIAYLPDENRLIISNNLIGVDNYWLQQLENDHKNNRIDLTEYLYA